MASQLKTWRHILPAALAAAFGIISCSTQPAEPTVAAAPTAEATSSPLAELMTAPIDEVLLSLQDLSFETFLEESFKQLTLRDPEAITDAGVATELGVRNDQLNDLSEEYVQDTYELQRGILDILRSYPPQELDDKQQVSWKIYEWYLDDLVRGQEFQYYDYPLHHFVRSYHDELVRVFTELQPMTTLSDAEDYVARLWQVERQVGQLLDGLEAREQLGIVPPDFILTMARSQLVQFLDLRSPDPASIEPGANPLYQSFQTKLDSIPGLGQEQVAALEAEALSAVEQSVTPAYLRLLGYLDHLQQVAGPEPGVWRFPQGDAYYHYLLRRETSTDLSPEEIHAIGLAEVERVQAELRQLGAELGYPPELSLSDLIDRARNEGGSYSGSTSSGDQQVLSAYEALLEAMQLRLEPAFDLRPQTGVVVVGDPQFGAGGYYVPPSSEGERPGAFHTGVGGSRVWKYSMPTVAYHEAIPGHHYQIALALETDLPTFQRQVIFNGYVEGWGLYAERLAKELGAYDDDPYGDIGRLQFELLRAVRLVTDTGLHDLRWSREQAQGYMNEALGDPSGSFAHEVDRYIVLPGQATGYMIGMLKILELRQHAVDQLGDQFDLREFHNVVLGNGSLPLEVLEDLVEDYIAEVSAP